MGGLWALRMLASAATGAAQIAILTAILALNVAQVIAAYLVPFMFFMAKLGFKLFLLAACYLFFSGFILSKIEPVVSYAQSLVPGTVDVLGRFFEFMQLTSTFVPWETMGTLFKYILIMKATLLLWHVADWIFNQVKSWTGFVTS
jgi:hypothetical protein